MRGGETVRHFLIQLQAKYLINNNNTIFQQQYVQQNVLRNPVAFWAMGQLCLPNRDGPGVMSAGAATVDRNKALEQLRNAP
jgi:hypothetical protein